MMLMTTRRGSGNGAINNKELFTTASGLYIRDKAVKSKTDCERQLELKTLQQEDDTVVTQSYTFNFCIYGNVYAVADLYKWVPFLRYPKTMTVNNIFYLILAVYI